MPDIDEAVDIRGVLVAARDALRRERPPEHALAERLVVYRSGRSAAGPPLAIMKAQPAEGGVPPYLISLAGSLFVSCRDRPPFVARELSPERGAADKFVDAGQTPKLLLSA